MRRKRMTTMKNKYTKKSLEEKKVEVQKLTKDMQTQINQYFDSVDDLKAYLSFMSRFYQYSLNNVALIQSKFPGAQAVGSYQFWKNHGYIVNKGEKGIPILVPQKAGDKFRDASGKWKAISKANEIEKKAIAAEKVDIRKGGLYFSIGHVFEISQTNALAADLPKIFPNRWLEGEVRDYNVLFRGMKKIAERNGIQFIEPRSELGAAKGVFYPLTCEVALNPRNSELQNVKTLLHELAHAKIHTHEKMENYTDAEREFQAEMTAYAVSFYFGLDTSEYSLRYLASWTHGKEFKDKTQLLKEVHETAVEFISTIEEEVQKWQEITHEENRQEKEKKQMGERSILFVTFQTASVEYEFMSIADLRQKVMDDANHPYRFSNRENVSTLSDEAFLAQFNTDNKERFAAIDENRLDRPSVLIQWSENGNLKQNTIIPFGEANERMAAIAKEQLNELGYQKTRYHLLIPKSLDPDFAKAEIIAMDRLDLGDGGYTSPYEQIIAEKPCLSEAVKAALKKEMEEARQHSEEKEASSVVHQPEQPSKIEVDLAQKYETFLSLKAAEDIHQVETIINRAVAEERYFATRSTVIENGLIAEDAAQKIEKNTEEKWKGEQGQLEREAQPRRGSYKLSCGNRKEQEMER